MILHSQVRKFVQDDIVDAGDGRLDEAQVEQDGAFVGGTAAQPTLLPTQQKGRSGGGCEPGMSA